MERSHWMLITASFLSLVCCQTVIGSPDQARVTRSTVETLRDHGTYIIHFKNSVAEIELKHFAFILEQKSISLKRKQFVAEIIEKMFTIKCLTAKLSKRALEWVRLYNS